MNQFYLYKNLEEVSTAAAQFFIDSANQTIAKKGRFIVSLAGGSTPKRMYELLASSAFKNTLDWSNIFILWGDERCVPATSPQSNYRMVKEALLNLVSIPENQIFPINGTLPPSEAASQYETTLKQLFDGPPYTDLCLLGLGNDGHTASLFPKTSILEVNDKWASEVYVEKMETWRISLTAPFIKASQQIAFLVAGNKKAAILPQVLHGPYLPEQFPSQLIIKGQSNIHWFLDEAAAKELPSTQ